MLIEELHRIIYLRGSYAQQWKSTEEESIEGITRLQRRITDAPTITNGKEISLKISYNFLNFF